MSDIDPVDEWEQTIRNALAPDGEYGYSLVTVSTYAALAALDSLLAALRVERERAEENRAGWDVAKMANSRYARQADAAIASRDAAGKRAAEWESRFEKCADDLDAVLARVQQAEEALLAYEEAVQRGLRAAPNHWHEYRDPFELAEPIRKARSLARAVLASSVSPAEEEK